MNKWKIKNSNKSRLKNNKWSRLGRWRKNNKENVKVLIKSMKRY